MAKKQFTASNKNTAPEIPGDFGAKLLFFHDIPEQNSYSDLNNVMILVAEDENLSGFLFGLIINENWHESLHKYMKSRGIRLSEQFHFVRMADAGKEGFESFESNVINLLARSDGYFLPDKSFTFKDFSLYVCETDEEARDITQYMGHDEDILVLYSQIFLPRDDIVDLVKLGRVAIRDADPDIVFNKSAYMRERLAFPEFFQSGNGNTLPDPSP